MRIRVYAAIKFFLFTQLSRLLMLIAILSLYFLHHAATGIFTFEYDALLGTPLSSRDALLLMLGFFVAFAVKLPMLPFHTWLTGCAHRGTYGRKRDPGGTVTQNGATGCCVL